jgi:hypothetical protein
MDLNAKTSCEKCGVAFLQTTAIRTGGYCMPCYQRINAPQIQYSPRQIIRPEFNDNTLINSGYFPGFGQDLTFWQTQILNNGQLQQYLNWDNHPDNLVNEIFTTQLSETERDQIQQFINQLNLTGIELAESYFSVSGPLTFQMEIPSINLKKELVSFDFFKEECTNDDFAWKSVQTYFKLWEYIDSLSQYRLKQHFAKKKSR